MRFGADDVKINVGNETLFLRPSLRACHRLEQKYQGFHNLYKAVEAGSLTAISDIIKEGSGQTNALTDYLDCADARPLMLDLQSIGVSIANFLVSLMGIEGATSATKGEPISYYEYHSRLFQIAAGWLGWSPSEAWEATPAEILEAQKGRAEMLRAVFGSGQKDSDETDIDLSKGNGDASAIARLNALGDLTNDRVPS